MRSHRTRVRFALGPLFAAAMLYCGAAPAAADDHVNGVITERADANAVYVKTDTGRVLMTVNEGTTVRQTSGAMRGKTLSIEDLIPGLRVRADGQFETPDRFVARRVRFSKDNMKMAEDIQAGVFTTDQRSLANQAAIEKLGGRVASDEQRAVATAGAINTRISNLDNFVDVKSMTVYFANGKYNVSEAQKRELEQLAAQAQGMTGYMISVAGFASAVGPGPLNQRLSAQRADAVTAILQQAGVPPANVMVPAAMGTSKQVSPNTTKKGQAENRRAVVTLMQNKGITDK